MATTTGFAQLLQEQLPLADSNDAFLDNFLAKPKRAAGHFSVEREQSDALRQICGALRSYVRSVRTSPGPACCKSRSRWRMASKRLFRSDNCRLEIRSVDYRSRWNSARMDAWSIVSEDKNCRDELAV